MTQHTWTELTTVTTASNEAYYAGRRVLRDLWEDKLKRACIQADVGRRCSRDEESTRLTDGNESPSTETVRGELLSARRDEVWLIICGQLMNAAN